MPFATSYDIHTQGHTELMRVMSNFHERMAGCRSGSLSAQAGSSLLIYISITILSFHFIRALPPSLKSASESSTISKWTWLNGIKMNLMNLMRVVGSELAWIPCECFDEHLFRIWLTVITSTFNYSRLLFASQGLQYSYDSSESEPNSELLMKSLHAATTVVRTFLERVAVSGLLRYAPDCYFVFAGFAATFMLKVSSCWYSEWHPSNMNTLSSLLILVHPRHSIETRPIVSSRSCQL